MKVIADAVSWYAGMALFGCGFVIAAEIMCGAVLCTWCADYSTPIIWACSISGITFCAGIICIAVALADTVSDVTIIHEKMSPVPQPDFTKPHTFKED